MCGIYVVICVVKGVCEVIYVVIRVVMGVYVVMDVVTLHLLPQVGAHACVIRVGGGMAGVMAGVIRGVMGARVVI